MKLSPRTCALVVSTGLLASLSLLPQQAGQPPQYVEKSYPIAPGNEPPDRNAQLQMHQKQAAKKDFDAANAERKRQIDSDCEELLSLARELNAEVDGSSRNPAGENTISPEIIRKAETIERLAHAVKVKMKLTVSGS